MTVDARRCLSLNNAPVTDGPVIYVMAREQRVHDNWALLHAQAQAKNRNAPLLVVFVVGPMFNNGTARHNEWMVRSLQDVERQLQSYKIPFTVRCGAWSETVATIVDEYKAGLVVLDFNPLEPVRGWREALAKKLTVSVVMVDARNIVPCWEASDKAEFAAYTFRPKITRRLKEFLVPFPAVCIAHTQLRQSVPEIDWELVRAYRKYDTSVQLPLEIIPGEVMALSILKDFLQHRLSGYATRRNNPNKAGTSRLSAYLRWGNISSATVALAVQKEDGIAIADREAFLEELIVRRELTDNYCYYTPHYATVAAAHSWAQKTLHEHRHDARPYLYTYEEFAQACTHDTLWNAAQRQLVEEGYMHGYLRMYWAKKILEWTKDAQTAIDIALRLNDTYQLDGRDSNGVVGVMWSICGVHDRAWNERPIFGKIRYMNYAGCKRKFDVKAFEEKYSARSAERLW